jgi:hypothetical protein
MSCSLNFGLQTARLRGEPEMSETALIPIEEDEDFEERVLRLRMQGKTAQQLDR